MATPAPGTNGSGRTPAEEQNYQRYQNSLKIGKGNDPSIAETFFKNLFKTPSKTMAPGPDKKKAALKKIAAAKAAKKVVPASKSGIPASPTH